MLQRLAESIPGLLKRLQMQALHTIPLQVLYGKVSMQWSAVAPIVPVRAPLLLQYSSGKHLCAIMYIMD